VLNNTKTQFHPKLLFLVPAISQTHKSLENSQDFFCQDQDQDQDQDFIFLSSRRLETKTLVSRTTSLNVCRATNQRWLLQLFPATLCMSTVVRN